ncbi:MAG: NAD(P)-dependent oxidoreductase [Nitriliruptoraceae bacterium]
MPQILVTGATGFVGRRLVKALLDDGHRVRALVRRTDEELTQRGVEQRLGGIDAIDDQLVYGCDAIVHGAASFVADMAEGRAVNRDATAKLAELALHHGAYYVLVSTCAVYNTGLAPSPVIDEDSPRRDPESMGSPTGSSSPVYGLTKAEGEIAVEALREQGLSAAILRPSSVLGVGETSTWGTKIPERLRAGEVSLRDPQATFGWLHVDDLVAAIMAALNGQANITVNLVSGHLPYRSYLDAIVAAVPGAIDVAAITPSEYDPAWAGTYATQRAKDLLGWQPRYSFTDAMNEIQNDLRRRWA